MINISDFKKNIFDNRIRVVSRKITKTIFIIFLISSGTSGCKKFIEVAPPDTSVSGETAFKTDATAISVLTSLYTKLSNEQSLNVSFPNLSTWIAGLSSDEFNLWSGATNTTWLGYYRNDPSAVNNIGTQVWSEAYTYLFTCNAVIEGLEKSNSLTPSIKQQLLGEAKFMRAFFYFYLVNFYGDVPLVLGTRYEVTSILPRSSKSTVYAQVIKDLKNAEELLSDTYLDANLTKTTTERIRPTKSAAAAMLARTYLFTGEWALAEMQASSVIDNSNYELLTPNSVFLKNSKEAIWQLQPTLTGWNTQQGRLLVLTSSGPNSGSPIYLSPALINSFEMDDVRMASWTSSVTVSSIKYDYCNKYKVNQYNSNITTPAAMSEYLMVLRLAELYLIRAEARCMQNKFQQAIDDVNMLRFQHGGLSTTLPAPTSQSSAMGIILHERFVELFSEWGHRWLDLKRTGDIDSVMAIVTPLKGGTWSSYEQLFPIPQEELNKNPYLTQNEGY